MSGASHKVHVNLDHRSYDIHIGAGLLSKAGELVPLALAGRNVFIVTDENVAKQGYPEQIRESLEKVQARSVQTLVLPAGEQTKSFDALKHILDWLLDNGVTRHSVMFTVGGGVIGDLGGFAASIVMRGIPFVQIPTTLLAQVDSSVGGKTAIDTPQGKNLVGTFYQPAAVICDTDVLQTLPRRELLAGYAEVLKYGLINDAEFFIWLEKNGEDLCSLDLDLLAHAVQVSCRKKAEIVIEDEKEAGVRALLNFGHTFAHMLEGVAGYDGRLLHGEAVAIGMVMAMRLSARLGYLEEEDAERLEEHLRTVGLPVAVVDITPSLEASADDFLAFLMRDKKATEEGAVFILSRGIGEAFIDRNVDTDDVRQIMKHSCKGK